jgi:hypothetical protein
MTHATDYRVMRLAPSPVDAVWVHDLQLVFENFLSDTKISLK